MRRIILSGMNILNLGEILGIKRLFKRRLIMKANYNLKRWKIHNSLLNGTNDDIIRVTYLKDSSSVTL